MPISQSENLSFPAVILSPSHDKKSSIPFLDLDNSPFPPKTNDTYGPFASTTQSAEIHFAPHRFLIFSLKLSIFQIESIIFATEMLHLGKTVEQIQVSALDSHYILLTLRRFYLW